MNKTQNRELPAKARTPSNSRFAVVYPKEKFWELLSNEFQTTRQIVDVMGCSWELAKMKLEELAKEGRAIKSPAGRIFLWKRAGTP